MNARSQTFELSVEGRQADEVVTSLFHTILFHRSLGKFMYTGDESYSVGTVGYMDVDCDFIDLTYVCCSSETLDRTIKREINGFSERLRNSDCSGNGQISLEFFQKKPRAWFAPECISWEIWTIRLELISLSNEGERQLCREKVSELIGEKILYIADVMNRGDYLPKMPNQTELDYIFDTSYFDVQPYLFKINYNLAGPSASSSVGTTVKNLISNHFSF
ncbi:unnamed protein product [Brassicogethes aeneus]|uniref:Autophagy-related protein 101 n=1 Tax=Brassicogethes aeneus TaxID=1431903 RepID=A0A9P0FQT8_BRAAE|nr:unnamed protein product [Brassicogethes aeneus]